VRGIQREREKREKGRLCLKTIKLGPKFETNLMFERKVRREKNKWLGDFSFSSLKRETKEFSFKTLEHLRRVCIRVGTIHI
jgi:hypothetical protein